MVAAVRDMAYVGATPWHGLGAKLTEGADLETWAREAERELPAPRSSAGGGILDLVVEAGVRPE